ncbi:MAG: hypothetical protein FJX37_00655 [Alphaproteobacteria bacterium]|nr:hypothetical protein [Alphaproteobacteria bacterium]
MTMSHTVRSFTRALLVAATLAVPAASHAICGNPRGCGSPLPSGGTIDCGKLNSCRECQAGPLFCCLTPPCTILNPPPPRDPDQLLVAPVIRRGFGHGFIFTK